MDIVEIDQDISINVNNIENNIVNDRKLAWAFAGVIITGLLMCGCIIFSIANNNGVFVPLLFLLILLFMLSVYILYNLYE